MTRTDIIGRLLRISQTTDDHDEEDRTTLEYASLIGEAKSRVAMVTGRLNGSKAILDSLEKARKRGATIEILTGPLANRDSIKQLQLNGVTVKILRHWPERHFAVIDGQHVRIEETHPESVNRSVQYIIHNYKHAERLDKYFTKLKESN